MSNSPRQPGPLVPFNGERPPAPAWFTQALAQAPQRSHTQVQGAGIETLVWGPQGAPGVLLMHGNGAHADWWSFIAPFLAKDFRVAAMSWSGMGGSDWRAAYSSRLYVEEAFAVAQAAGLFESTVKPSFVGHSFGGFPTMAAAALQGERLRQVVLMDTPLWTPELRRARKSPRDPAREFKPARVYPTLTEALARFRLMPEQPCEPLYIVDHIARAALREVKVVSGASGSGKSVAGTTGADATGYTWRFDPFLWKNYTGVDSSLDLAAVKCPVSLVWGAQSSLMPKAVVDYMRSLSPAGTRCVEVPQAGHHLLLDQPLATISVLRSLLAV